MDNLDLISQKVNQDIDPNGVPGSILAQNHNDILQQFLRNSGKYVGFPFLIRNDYKGVSGIGNLFVSSAMNDSGLVLKVSGMTADGNSFLEIIKSFTPNDYLQLKDFKGRSFFFTFESFQVLQDDNNVDYLEINVSPFVENQNYTYQTTEIVISMMNVIKQDLSFISDDLALKEDKANKGIADGYVPLNNAIKIAAQYLDIVNDLVTGGTTSLLSAEQGVVLKGQIDAINVILNSDDINLDTLQEIVDAIKDIDSYLATIIVNDLTTGGTTKALSAEMGKVLKNLIDTIYQPNVLIETTTPTRATNTFTYPALGYKALINKIIYQNPVQFVTTIAVATDGFKRTDLVYITTNGVIAKKTGVESTSVAVRPDLLTDEVAISFINVFGGVIDNPTPVNEGISIQDSLGVEKFKIFDYLRFTGVGFNEAQKRIEIVPLVSNRIFLSSIGNDLTAEPQDRTKPFLTLNAAVNWLLSQSHLGFDWYIEIISNGTFTYSLNMYGVGGLNKTLRGFNIINASSARVIIANNFRVTEQYFFNFPNGILEYNYTDSSVTVASGSFTDISTINFKQDISTVEFKTSRTDGGTLDRGFHRNFSINSNSNYINWNTVNYYNGCSNFADNYPSAVPIKINLLNNYNTIYFYKDFTAVYGGVMNFLSINTYVNQTSVTQEIFAYNLEVENVSSVNALTSLNFNSLALKSNSSYVNVVFRKVTNASKISTINGNGYTLNCNYTIASNFYLATSGNSFKTGNNQKTTGQNEIKNININITGSLFNRLSSIDLRSGRFGEQYLFDNVNINFDTAKPLFAIDNFQEVGAGYQVIFRNSVNIINGSTLLAGGLVGGALVQNINKNFIVQENASIFHDFGKIHSIGYFPPINQYNTYNNIRRNELRVSLPIQVINNSIRNDFTYVVDGVLTLIAGQFINIPLGGATIFGYGFDVSKIVKNVAGEAIFTGAGIGNLILKDLSIDSGLGSVFDLTDNDGTHAIEFNDINFDNCSSLGNLKGFRQFTGQTIGIYNCANGLKLSGAWNGFVMTKLHVRGFANTGTVFLKNTDTTFSNRFSLGINISGVSGYKILDFDNTIFSRDKMLQLNDCTVEVDGVIDESNTLSVIPNINENDARCKWVNSEGLKLTAVDYFDIKSVTKIWRLSIDDLGVISTTEI